jgi:hypothetical protein
VARSIEIEVRSGSDAGRRHEAGGWGAPPGDGAHVALCTRR